MNTEILDQAAIIAKYPVKKPTCFNYAVMRAELLALAEETEILRSLLTEISKQ